MTTIDGDISDGTAPGGVHHDGLAFHNVGELRDVDGAKRLQRLPESVRESLNEDARDRYLVPSGSEIRFVPGDDSATVTLSCPAGWARIRPFWGPYQVDEPIELDDRPLQVELAEPDELEGFDVTEDRPGGFSRRVARLRIDHHSGGAVHYHGSTGETRPPRDEEVPARTLLAYGTSITEGFSASGTHLTYPSIAARRLGVDHLNLGTAGSAYCEPELADHVAGRDDWDVALLSVSVNMLGTFPTEEFRERAGYLVDRIADENSERPIVAVTLFPLRADFEGTGAETEPEREAYRRTLREIVADADHDDVHLIEGTDLLRDATGHTTDLVHPSDHGMIEIGRRLAIELEPILDGA